MRRIDWTPVMIEILTETYPVESTRHTCELLGVSMCAVKKKATELGLVKFRKTRWMERAAYIRQHFHEKSYTSMARELGVSLHTVSRIVAALGLKRTKEERIDMISRSRRQLISRERRRLAVGFSPVSRLKVVCNRPRINLRSKLKALGYVVGGDSNIMYYPPEIKRCRVRERNGAVLGLRFMPLPAQSKDLLTSAI